MTASVIRTVIITVAAVGVLFALVPHHYWGVLLLAIKATASIGVAALTVRAYVRRRP